jgi:hypothetical protein
MKMHLKETGYEDVKWINLAQHMDQWPAVMNPLMQL